MAAKPRILVLEGASHQAGDLLQRCQPDWELVRVENPAHGLALLNRERFDGVYADTLDSTVRARADHLIQAERILEALSDGLAVVSADLRITWANATFERWCGGCPLGAPFYEALASSNLLGPNFAPFHTALAGKHVTTRLHARDNRYLELSITPMRSKDGGVVQLITLVRDVTAEVQREQKLDALHKAANELAALTADELSEMSVEDRVEWLKQNIRTLIHNLLHYDVIKVCLLDSRTGRLEPLLHEGMGPGAAERVLYAREEGNGITGYVAATGKSYLCRDTTADPRYLEGGKDARCSMTVPLLVQDKVIGTFNVESPKQNTFGEEDLKFLETFGREIAIALHTLQLLTAEMRSSAWRSVEAIGRAVALPVDEILNTATSVLDRYIGHDQDMSDKLKQILASARSIKQAIQKIGEGYASCSPTAQANEQARPALKGLRLLVADQDERVRRSAHSILGGFGCVVETARDGKEALTMAKLGTYDIILADIRLPDVSGYEVYQQLRAAQPLARVILMTTYGYDPSHSIVKARQDGLRHVLFKPFRVDQLLEALERSSPTDSPGPKCGL